MNIPKKFYMADEHPTVGTVGELKKLLAELPDELPVHSTFEDMVQLVVYNRGQPDMHLQFIEPEEMFENKEDDLPDEPWVPDEEDLN